MVERDIKRDDVCVIKVADTRVALARLSAAFFSHPAQKMKNNRYYRYKGKDNFISYVKEPS